MRLSSGHWVFLGRDGFGTANIKFDNGTFVNMKDSSTGQDLPLCKGP